MWILKIIAKLIISQLKIPYSIFSKLKIYKHGDMENSHYAINIFHNHYKNSKLKKNDCILELGPGDSISTAIIAYKYDLNSILIDNGNFVTKNIKKYYELIEALNFSNQKKNKLLSSKNLDEILKQCNSKFYTSGIEDFKKLKSESVDFIFSNAVLEHVYLNQFPILIKLFHKVLKKNCLMSHQVDLKDHLSNNLNHLRFKKKIWESEIFKKSGFYTNRININKMISLFKNENFFIEKLIKYKWDILPIKKEYLNYEFQNISDDNLKVKSFYILLKK